MEGFKEKIILPRLFFTTYFDNLQMHANSTSPSIFYHKSEDFKIPPKKLI